MLVWHITFFIYWIKSRFVVWILWPCVILIPFWWMSVWPFATQFDVAIIGDDNAELITLIRFVVNVVVDSQLAFERVLWASYGIDSELILYVRSRIDGPRQHRVVILIVCLQHRTNRSTQWWALRYTKHIVIIVGIRCTQWFGHKPRSFVHILHSYHHRCSIWQRGRLRWSQFFVPTTITVSINPPVIICYRHCESIRWMSFVINTNATRQTFRNQMCTGIFKILLEWMDQRDNLRIHTADQHWSSEAYLNPISSNYTNYIARTSHIVTPCFRGACIWTPTILHLNLISLVTSLIICGIRTFTVRIII